MSSAFRPHAALSVAALLVACEAPTALPVEPATESAPPTSVARAVAADPWLADALTVRDGDLRTALRAPDDRALRTVVGSRLADPGDLGFDDLLALTVLDLELGAAADMPAGYRAAR